MVVSVAVMSCILNRISALMVCLLRQMLMWTTADDDAYLSIVHAE